MLYAEFKISGDWHYRNLAYESLRLEIRRWAHGHGIDHRSIHTEYHSDSGSERVYLPTDRVAELWAISWAPKDSYWSEYKLRRSI